MVIIDKIPCVILYSQNNFYFEVIYKGEHKAYFLIKDFYYQLQKKLIGEYDEKYIENLYNLIKNNFDKADMLKQQKRVKKENQLQKH